MSQLNLDECDTQYPYNVVRLWTADARNACELLAAARYVCDSSL